MKKSHEIIEWPQAKTTKVLIALSSHAKCMILYRKFVGLMIVVIESLSVRPNISF